MQDDDQERGYGSKLL